MRTRLLLPPLLLLSALPVAAQVTVDPRALAPLTPNGQAAPNQTTAPAKPVPRKPVTPLPRPSPKPSSTVVRPVPPSPPGVPAAPPPPLALPAPIAVPTRPLPPAAPAAVTADAPGTADPTASGLRVTFGAGRADFNPSTETAIRGLVHAGPAAAGTSYTITSYAAGTPEDPSTARRLSLSRALGVRSVLISQGVASIRIYVKALGPASQGFADGPPDRADIVVAANPLPTPAPNPAQAANSAPTSPPVASAPAVVRLAPPAKPR